MKKFMKAIAFVTVMCLFVSTAAFAAGDVTVTDYTAKKVTVNVVDLQKDEQVSIIITKSSAEDYDFKNGTILFIDQKAAPSTSAVFEAEVTDSSVNAIDVYAGYASNTRANAVKVANDVMLTKDTKLTFVAAQVIDDVTAQGNYDEESMKKVDEGTKGSVVWLKLNATNVAAGDLTQMWWAFHVKDSKGNDDTKYVRGTDKIIASFGSVCTGDVEIAAAFESTGYTVTGVNAVFLLNDEDVHTATGDKLNEIKADKVN